VTRAVITGWGKCRPPLSLTNADLERLVETSDDWIAERTGITERGLCHMETTDMAEVAARHALAAAGLEPTDLDLIIMCTLTPEVSCPSAACSLQERTRRGERGGLRSERGLLGLRLRIGDRRLDDRGRGEAHRARRRGGEAALPDRLPRPEHLCPVR
jgi:hypothetical protein